VLAAPSAAATTDCCIATEPEATVSGAPTEGKRIHRCSGIGLSVRAGASPSPVFAVQPRGVLQSGAEKLP